MKYPTQERLKELFDYCPETGLFVRKKSVAVNALKGDVFGYDLEGYLAGYVGGEQYRLHRLAWIYMHGSISDMDIDHINRNRSDNRLDNLRLVTRSTNCMNLPLKSNNKSGLCGVCWAKDRGKWFAQIAAKGNYERLGYHDNIFDAACARISAQNRLGFSKTHGK